MNKLAAKQYESHTKMLFLSKFRAKLPTLIQFIAILL